MKHCKECGRQFRQEDLEGDFSTRALASTISNGVKAESERDELKRVLAGVINAFSVTRSDDFIFIETRQGAFGQVDDIGYWSEASDSGDLQRYRALDEMLKSSEHK
jgi:hypothetical protein